jgi:hypothetical protein
MRQYKDLAVKDPGMGVFNLNGLRADCKMSRWALRRFGLGAPAVAAIASTYGLYRLTSGVGQHMVLALMGAVETREAAPYRWWGCGR